MNTDTPKVAVIIINWNSYEDTSECLESLLEVGYNNFSTIVVDNNSSDDSLRKLKNDFSWPEFIENEDNYGFAKGNNIGIKYAVDNGAEYVLLLNNDTTVTPNFIDILVETHEKVPKCGVTTGKIYHYRNQSNVWYSGGDFFTRTFRVSHYEDDSNEIDYVTDVPGCLMMISADVINQVGLLNEDYFMYSEDTEYCYRVIKQGFNMVINRKCIIYHKNSSSSRTSDAPPELRVYYSTRNRILMIKQHAPIKIRPIALLYHLLWSLLAIILWSYRGWWGQIRALFHGINHGFRTREGICEDYH